MAKKCKKPYESFFDLKEKRKQIEYTEPTKLLDENGNLLVVGGWARHNIFEFDRALPKPAMRQKDWEFYQVSDGDYMLQISIANISIGGYASAVLTDLRDENHEKKPITSMALWLGGKNKVVLPENCDQGHPNVSEYKKGKYHYRAETTDRKRTVFFSGPVKNEVLEAKIEMDLFENHENITIVTPFKKRGKYMPTRFFMTMKQNCMPAEGYFKCGEKEVRFEKEKSFCALDWAKGVWPYKNVWYWGNGAQRIKDADGKEHIFGFEITWGIGDESNATETCLFYDGKAHKIGSVDVVDFPKSEGKWLEPWHFVSDDGRLDFVMTPYYDNHTDTNALNILRLHAHQVHGLWNGTATLDDGTVLEIKDMYAFCEWVENKW